MTVSMYLLVVPAIQFALFVWMAVTLLKIRRTLKRARDALRQAQAAEKAYYGAFQTRDLWDLPP